MQAACIAWLLLRVDQSPSVEKFSAPVRAHSLWLNMGTKLVRIQPVAGLVERFFLALNVTLSDFCQGKRE